MNYSVRNIVIAAGLALCAIVAVLVYTSNVQKSAQGGQTLVKVLVARGDIKAGTTFDQIRSGSLLEEREVRKTDQLPGVLTGAQLASGSLSGTILSQQLYAGQQVPAAVFEAAATSAVPTQLQRTQRAIQLPFDPDSGALGTVHTGDHVDVLVAVRITKPDGSDEGVVRRLLTDVPVLKAPDSDSSSGGIAGGSGSSDGHVLLEVSDSQAAKLLWGKQFGTALWLVARPASHAEDSAVSAQTVSSVLLDGLNDKQLRDLIKHSQIQAN